MNEQVDPAMRAAFESLTPDTQAALLRREPRAERALRDAYLAERARRTVQPNRAARRQAQRARKTTR